MPLALMERRFDRAASIAPGTTDSSGVRASMSARVKVCGCRPHDGGAAHTGAGVRKPPMEETAMGERMMVAKGI